MRIISTGSSSLDRILCGGIRTGLITNVLSETKEVRSSFCYSLCINAAGSYKDSSIIFGDTQGIFRPEKIFSYIEDKQNSNSILNAIRRIRILTTTVQMVIVKYALNLHPVLIIIDNFTYLFLNENKKPILTRFNLMKHLHDLALAAIENDIAIVITNSFLPQKENKNLSNQDIIQKKIFPYYELNSIISHFTHVTLELKRLKVNESTYSAKLVKPVSGNISFFTIMMDGLCDSR